MSCELPGQLLADRSLFGLIPPICQNRDLILQPVSGCGLLNRPRSAITGRPALPPELL